VRRGHPNVGWLFPETPSILRRGGTGTAKCSTTSPTSLTRRAFPNAACQSMNSSPRGDVRKALSPTRMETAHSRCDPSAARRRRAKIFPLCLIFAPRLVSRRAARRWPGFAAASPVGARIELRRLSARAFGPSQSLRGITGLSTAAIGRDLGCFCGKPIRAKTRDGSARHYEHAAESAKCEAVVCRHRPPSD
jgi:hypothetical protein